MTVDNVIYRFNEDIIEVLLIKRRPESRAFPNYWALPGGHLEPNETAVDGATRELEEETGIRLNSWDMSLLGVFSEPGRDPRGPYVSIAYESLYTGKQQPRAGDDARDVGWFNIYDLPDLAFDHKHIIKKLGF